MKSKRIVALGSALVLGTTTALAGLPTFVYAQEETETVQGVQTEADKPAMFAAVPDIAIPELANNIALGKTVTSSSNEDNNLIPGNLVDGSGAGTSRWSSGRGTGPQWVQIDLRASHVLTGVNLFWESGKANSYKVQVSSDGNTWTDEYVNASHPTQQRDAITFTEPVKGQYVKLYIDSVSNVDPWGQVANWDTVSLYEIQVLEGKREPADKSALQAMYDSKKGLQQEYIGKNSNVPKKYADAVAEAERVLNAVDATQEEVNKATDKLENCYWLFLVEEEKWHYSPAQSNFDYSQYTTESVLPIRKAYENSGSTTGSRTTESLISAYNAFAETKKLLVEKPEEPRGQCIGINEKFEGHKTSQVGEFIFSDYLKINEDGTETPMLHIEFVNSDNNVLTGEEVKSTYQWSEFDFKRDDTYYFLDWTPYYPTETSQGGIDWLTDYVVVTDTGFEIDVPMEHGPGIYTVSVEYRNSKRLDSLGVYYSHEYEKAMEMNKAPVISTDSEEDTITLQVGAEFDPLSAVKVVDEEDGEITLTKENVIKNDVNTAKAGTYHVTYRVTDKNGAFAEKTITVIVKAKEVDPPTEPENPDKPGEPNTPGGPDKPGGTDKPDKTDKNDKPASPKTGDPVSAGLAVSMLAGSTGALAVLFGKKRNKK